MSKRAPSTTQLLVIAGFALSCFGILLFLWVTFGGPTPFKAKPYEIKVPFNEATQLAEQSDVRISGVNVGKVQNIALAPERQAGAGDDRHRRQVRAAARIHAGDPAHQDAARRDLRRTDPRRPRTARSSRTAARCPRPTSPNRSSSTRSSAPSTRETRAAFQNWMQEAAVAINGQGQGLSYALGEFEPTFTEFDRLFRVLDTQRVAVGQLFRNGATTFRALRGTRRGAGQPDPSSNAVFQTTARARPGHRSALPRLPDLPRRVEADPGPAQELRPQHRPADAPARPRRRTALADPDRVLASWRRKRRASSKASPR